MADEPAVNRALPEQVRLLSAALDPALVEHLKDRGGVPYVETFNVINQANRIFGYAGWSYTLTRLECVERHPAETRNGNKYEAQTWIAVVRVTANGVTREDVGTGYVTSSDLDMGIMGAVSTALKRALRTFGAQFGNDLYDKDGDRPTPRESEQARRAEANSSSSNGNGAAAAPALSPEEAKARANAEAWANRLKAPIEFNPEQAKALVVDEQFLNTSWTSIKGAMLWSALLLHLKLGLAEVTPADVFGAIDIFNDVEITSNAQLEAYFKEHQAEWRAAIVRHVGLELAQQAAGLSF